MNNLQPHICVTCGAKVVEHRHSIFNGMIKVLGILFISNKPCHLRHLSLTVSEVTNAQKLQYWKLAEKTEKGYWQITEKGRQFIAGIRMIPQYVTTFRNDVIQESEQLVGIEHYHPTFLTREDYQHAVREQIDNAKNSNQGSLF